MKEILLRFITVIVILVTATKVCGQPKVDTPIHDEMTFEWKGDTLYSTTGLKLYVGQQLMIGKPSGIDGYFRSVISKKAAIVPSIWGQDKRYENAI